MRLFGKYILGWQWVALLACTGLWQACERTPEDVDVSHISLNLQIDRFEQALFKFKTDSSEQHIRQLKEQYGTFFKVYTAGVINIGTEENPSFRSLLSGFVNDPQINELLTEVNKVYPATDSLQHELENAFKHYLYYFPGKPVPKVLTYISGFNTSLIATEEALGIGLDMYLGPTCKYYQMLMLPQYKVDNMRPACMVPDCMRGWLTSEMVLDEANSTLLAQMIYHGKVLYFLDKVIPGTKDRFKIGYTDEQLAWCEQNESQMWAHLVDAEMLYSTDFTKIIKYVGEAPFTVGFPEGSPGRTGRWLGWQIVRSFMKNNKAISLEELMQIEDEQQILSRSRYKPGN